LSSDGEKRLGGVVSLGEFLASVDGLMISLLNSSRESSSCVGFPHD
jgi:hypothetical protein